MPTTMPMLTSRLPLMEADPSAHLAAWTNLGEMMLARRRRSMARFAEEELVVPTGPHEGTRFRPDRQPFQRLFFDLVDSGNWRRFVLTGPQQVGKSFASFVTPTLYHLFELGETVIWGVPNMTIAKREWRKRLLPAIMATRYRDLLPARGEGSRGGEIENAVQLGNGAELCIMTSGGDDKSRSNATARVVVITETDGMDEASEGSREADPIEQLEGRTRSFDDRARVYMECTVSTEDGRTWREYQAGTTSRIVLQCPHCRQWVTPEREHLVGWREAQNVVDAGRGAQLCCPRCAATLTDDERITANRRAKVLHRGQEIDEAGVVTGDPPQTDTLGFRATCVNNAMGTMSRVGEEEWRAARDPDEANAEKKMRQWWWVLPTVTTRTSSVNVEASDITHRQGDWPRGIVPPWTDVITVGSDVGKYSIHWSATAWSLDCRAHVIDYGVADVPSAHMPMGTAIMNALRQLRDTFDAGWSTDGADRRKPMLVLVDSGDGNQSEAVYAFCLESGAVYRPSKGYGASMYNAGAGGRYRAPRNTGTVVLQLGDHWHLAKPADSPTSIFELDVDHHKSFVHQLLRKAVDKEGKPLPFVGVPGSLTLFRDEPNKHLTYAKHLVAERRTEEFVPTKGLVTRWQATNKNNHFLDAETLSAAAASACNVRLVSPAGGRARPQTERPSRTARSGWNQWRQ